MKRIFCFIFSFLMTPLVAFNFSNEELALRANEIVQNFYKNDPILDLFLANQSWDPYWQTRVEHRVFYIDRTDDVIKNFLNNGSPWEVYIYEYLWRYTRPGSTAIDIGAHVGTHTINLAEFVENHGRVIAFEPQCKMFSELAINVYLNGGNNVSLYRGALGEAQGVITMNQRNESNEGGTGFGLGGDVAPLYSLDSFGFDNVSIIKIDVEGNEENVLAGARETIQRNRPIILLEIMGGASREAAAERVRSIFLWMKKLGYVGKYLNMCDYVFCPKEGVHLIRGGKYDSFIVKEYY